MKYLLMLIFASCSSITPKLVKEEMPVSNIQIATQAHLDRSVLLTSFKENNIDQSFTEIFFTSYEPVDFIVENSIYESYPSILIKRNVHAAPEFLTFPNFINYGWEAAFQLMEKGYYWGFLDYQVEGPIEELIIVWSQDSGKTWNQLSTLKKNFFADNFYSFSIDKNGIGSAIIQRINGNENENNGFDVFNTNDFGRSWSLPVFQRNVNKAINPIRKDCASSLKPIKKILNKCAIPFNIK